MTRDPEAARRRILDAAIDAFARHGFAGARIDGIAREAGLNKRMLYHYFGDKQALFESACAQAHEQLTLALSASPQGGFSIDERWWRVFCAGQDAGLTLPGELLEAITGGDCATTRERETALLRTGLGVLAALLPGLVDEILALPGGEAPGGEAPGGEAHRHRSLTQLTAWLATIPGKDTTGKLLAREVKPRFKIKPIIQRI